MTDSEIDETANLEFEEIEGEEATIDVPLERRRLMSETKDLSIRELYFQHKEGDLVLQPEFQRYYVFDDGKASRLIESLLLEVPLPIIYLSQEKDGKNEVIDGQQRLTSFMRFLDGEFSLRGLSVLKEFNGEKYVDLSKEVQGQISKSTLRCVIVKRDSDPDIKFEIFQRLNTGSVKLNDQELRNCIYRGTYNQLLRDLAQDSEWLALINAKEPDRRMQDREMILRFFAFYHGQNAYKPPMKKFLNDEAEAHRILSDAQMNSLRQLFRKSARLSRTVFGERVFKRLNPGSVNNHNAKWEEKRLNMALYDIIMVGFTKYDEREVIPKLDRIRDTLYELMTTNSDFIDAITLGTSDKTRVRTRFDLWSYALQAAIGSSPAEPRFFSEAFKAELFKQNPTCSICNQRISVIDDSAVDHIIPYSLGGSTEAANGRLTHRYCNWERGNRQ